MVDPHRTSAMHVASSTEALSRIIRMYLQQDYAGENCLRFLEAVSASISRYQKVKYPTQTLKSAMR